MSDDDAEFEVVTSDTQFGDPPELFTKRVDLPKVKTRNGKTARVFVREMTARDASRYDDSNRKYVNGAFVGMDYRDSDMKLLAVMCRDHKGNRLWPTLEDAIARLELWGQATINILTAACNEVNSAASGQPVSDEDLEKKSETTPAETSS